MRVKRTQKHNQTLTLISREARNETKRKLSLDEVATMADALSHQINKLSIRFRWIVRDLGELRRHLERKEVEQ